MEIFGFELRIMIKEPLTIEKLEQIIKEKKMKQLIEYAENDFFDAKGSFYNLHDPNEKHELCKDVTAFINNDGGYLIIGCETEKPITHALEFVKDAKGIVDFPNMDSVYSIFSEYIYPNNIGTFISNEQITTDDKKKFLVFKINKNEEGKPYFVKKTAVNREYIAYYIRTYDRAIRFHIEYLHELVHQGIYFERYLKNLTGASAKILDNTEKLIGKTKKSILLGMRYDIKKDL
ncbi:ATP-binding protein [Patescibacteria group bacterium]|nr:ATP-binding protein [Patescibacteria group bacterium]MBU4023018.1 ATP-binding protein [Patescibacteria group bacterium]